MADKLKIHPNLVLILSLTHTEWQWQGQASYNAGPLCNLGMGLGPMFKCHHSPVLYDV